MTPTRNETHGHRMCAGLPAYVAMGSMLATLMIMVGEGEAQAAVQGRRGLEIEGARDRRGFYFGAGLGVGGTFYNADATDFIPALRIDATVGGGVAKRLTLGVDLHVTPYLTARGGVSFGGDVETTGFVFRGLFLRAALGVLGVPRGRTWDDGLTVGIGGVGGIGYEFFLNSSAAFGTMVGYDLRFVPSEDFPRQTVLVSLRFTWY